MRLAVLFDHFGPYHLARLRAISARCETLGVEFRGRSRDYAWELSDRTNSHLVTVMNEPTPDENAWRAGFRPSLSAVLAEFKPDVVAVPGWSSHGALTSMDWCLEHEVPAVLMSESSEHDEPRVWWKEFVKRHIVHLCPTALVGGCRHAAYLRQLGMPESSIFIGYDVVDNAHFSDTADRAMPDATKVPHFLASSRFIEKKNLPLLLEAYAEYRSQAGDGAWDLVLLGDGPLRPLLESMVGRLKLEGHLTMPGFKQYDELPGYYAAASAFVHASTAEQWGLVVNEAAAAGLPLIVSDRCGCVPELVHDGVNGYVFDPMQKEQLVDKMVKMSRLDTSERARLGQASRAAADTLKPEQFGEGLHAAAALALSSTKRRMSLLDRAMFIRLLNR